MGKRSWKSKSSSRSSSGSTCIARRQAARYVPLKVPMHGQHVPAAQHSALVRCKTVFMGLFSGSSPWSSALTCDGKKRAGIQMIPLFFLCHFLNINFQLLGHLLVCFPILVLIPVTMKKQPHHFSLRKVLPTTRPGCPKFCEEKRALYWCK